MNKFAWSVTITGDNVVDLDYDYIESMSVDWNKNVFVFWETEFKTSQEIVDFFKEKFGELLSYDISIESEDKIEIFAWEYEEWVYELASFEWEQVKFSELIERFSEIPEVVSIREAEISKKFGNRVVKVDFVY